MAQPDLQRVVQTLMRAFCYRTIITALELGKPDRAAAMGRVRSLKPVKEGDPKAWEDMGMHVSLRHTHTHTHRPQTTYGKAL